MAGFIPRSIREAAVGAALGAAVGAAVGAAQAGVHGRALGARFWRAGQPQRWCLGKLAAPATPRVVAGRREAVARELQRLPSALGKRRGPRTGPATFSPVPEPYDRSFPPRGGINRHSAGALSTTPLAPLHIIAAARSESLPPGSLASATCSASLSMTFDFSPPLTDFRDEARGT